MTKMHTAGPWKWFSNTLISQTKPNDIVLRVLPAFRLEPHDEALVAAAPDLLAALEDIARGDYSDPFCRLTPEQRARDAIAKVKGHIS